jgi:hypothetical protein
MLLNSRSLLTDTRLIHLTCHHIQKIQGIIEASRSKALNILLLSWAILHCTKAASSRDRTGSSRLGSNHSLLRTCLRRLDYLGRSGSLLEREQTRVLFLAGEVGGALFLC